MQPEEKNETSAKSVNCRIVQIESLTGLYNVICFTYYGEQQNSVWRLATAIARKWYFLLIARYAGVCSFGFSCVHHV